MPWRTRPKLAPSGKARAVFQGVIFVITCIALSSFFPSHRNCAVTGMRVGWVWCTRRAVRHNVTTARRLLSSHTQPQADALQRATRNIGIIAHIDAVSTAQGSMSAILLKFRRAKRLRQSVCSIILGTPEELAVRGCQFLRGLFHFFRSVQRHMLGCLHTETKAHCAQRSSVINFDGMLHLTSAVFADSLQMSMKARQ